jgi:hypothetical protein
MRYRMHMRNLDRRVHLLLDEPRYRKVEGEARRRRVSVATVIREAIDHLPAEGDRRRDAIAGILAAEPMPVPADPADLVRELDEARGASAG